jgi:holo-[acyl-carrier protein] synthase
MIIGIGTDIIELNKVRAYASKKYFLESVFTEKEIKCTKGDVYHLATTFAAKEAIFKALGTGWLNPKEIEIIRDKNGKPEVNLLGNLRKLTKLNNIKNILLNLSYCDNYALAFAIIEK